MSNAHLGPAALLPNPMMDRTTREVRESKLTKDYTPQEELAIIDFIIKYKMYTSLRGRAMWMRCSEYMYGVRTWQSLKEHFKRKMVGNLYIYQSIPIEEREKIYQSYLKSGK